MRKLAVFLCTGVMIASLTACGDKSADDGQSSSAVGSSEAGSSAENSAIESSVAGSAEGNATESSSDETIDHNYEEGWTEEMEGVKTAIVEALGDNYFPNMPLPPELLEERFGITADMYVDYFAEIPMISTNVDTLVIIKAKSDKVEEVEEALNAYRDAQVNDAFQYPRNIGIVQASRIERFGNYVCYAQLGGELAGVEENGDEAIIIHCQELDELVLEIIGQNVQ